MNFTVVRLADDEKFACGYVNTTTGSFRVISAFYLYVKGEYVNQNRQLFLIINYYIF